MKPAKPVFYLVILIFVVGAADAGEYRAGEFDYFVLALSWQSAYCEIHQNKPECQQQKEHDYSAHNFVLHGLWPNKDGDKKHAYGYCGINKQTKVLDIKGHWCQAMPVYDNVELEQKMPGTQSCLQMHEWIRHGVCSNMSISSYFDVSLDLLDYFITTQLASMVRNNIGKSIQKTGLLTAWQEQFPKANSALVLRCRKVGARSYLSEVRIALKKPLSKDFKDNLLARRVGSSNCSDSIYIDEVGF